MPRSTLTSQETGPWQGWLCHESKANLPQPPAWQSPSQLVKSPQLPSTVSVAWTTAQGALRLPNWIPDDLGTNDMLSSFLIGLMLMLEMALARARGRALTQSRQQCSSGSTLP